MKLDKEIQDAIHSIKMSIFAANDMLEDKGMTETHKAKIEGKRNGLELALRIIGLAYVTRKNRPNH